MFSDPWIIGIGGACLVIIGVMFVVRIYQKVTAWAEARATEKAKSS